MNERTLAILIALSLLLSACVPVQPVTPEGVTPQVVTVIVQVTAAPANNVQATDAPAEATPASDTLPTPTVATIPVTNQQATLPANDPQCTALQNINFRKGPGRVFDPPLDVIGKGSSVTPNGFAPLGFPDGAWVQITHPLTGQSGWISTDPNLLTCTFDLASLPVVAAPPTPAVVRLRSSKPDGSANGITGNLHFSARDLLRFEAIGPEGQSDGDYMAQVRFLVRDASGATTYYDHTEQNEPYCIFSGDDTCAPWTKRDGQYVWGSDGEPIQSGATYQFDIFATSDEASGSREGNWSFTVTIDLP